MTSRVATVAFQGIEAVAVDVQAQFLSGQVQFHIVGLPDKAVAESRERVRAALHAIGLALPGKRLVINLSPADLPKEGSHFDLPIALGVLVGAGRHPAGFPAAAMWCWANWRSMARSCRWRARCLPPWRPMAGSMGLICPKASGAEAAWAGEDVDILAPGQPHPAHQPCEGHAGAVARRRPALAQDAGALPDLARHQGPGERPSGRWKWRRPVGIIC